MLLELFLNMNNSDQHTAGTTSPGQNRAAEISAELQTILQGIVDDVVSGLGCVGALVATLEMDNSLPVRAYAVDLAPGLLEKVENRLRVKLVGPDSVVYLDDKRFADNLSVRALQGQAGTPQVMISDELFDLFRPGIAKAVADVAQQMTGIKQVVAVPIFIGDEVVGNLAAASRETFSDRDIDFLTAFSSQAATAIQSRRYLTEMRALERVILSLQASITNETQVLQIIVDTVVEKLKYVGAIVATLEADNALPVRAYAVGFETGLLEGLEEKSGVKLLGPRSVAYLDDERFQDNLSVRAVKGENGRPSRFVTSDRLYDLFRPVVNKPLSDLAQKLTGIKQVMAVPFFLEDEVVGNLFVASRKEKFYEWEQELLVTFGQQAAVGIRNARLFRIAEERRQIAEMFGKMAFSAAANIHALRNHIGAPRTYLQLLEMQNQLSLKQLEDLQSSGQSALIHLDQAINILDTLHEPWEQIPDVPSDVNDCLLSALKKVFTQQILDMDQAEVETGEGIIIRKSLSDELPLIETSPDMLTEVFRVLVKNAVEAVNKRGPEGGLWIESRCQHGEKIEILIRDNGLGIKPADLTRIFDLGWTTKNGEGMGFGLFWARDYVEGLGGEITVESVWQEGTTFHVSVPLANVD
jgi:signal transduction histidine kinase